MTHRCIHLKGFLEAFSKVAAIGLGTAGRSVHTGVTRHAPVPLRCSALRTRECIYINSIHYAENLLCALPSPIEFHPPQDVPVSPLGGWTGWPRDCATGVKDGLSQLRSAQGGLALFNFYVLNDSRCVQEGCTWHFPKHG